MIFLWLYLAVAVLCAIGFMVYAVYLDERGREPFSDWDSLDDGLTLTGVVIVVLILGILWPVTWLFVLIRWVLKVFVSLVRGLFRSDTRIRWK